MILGQVLTFKIHPADAELQLSEISPGPCLCESGGNLLKRQCFLVGIGNLRGNGEGLHKNILRPLGITRLRHGGGNLL